jgi:hypothetical protein
LWHSQKKERERERGDVKLRHIRVSIVAAEEQQVLHILCLCIRALFTQHALGMRRIILSSVVCPVLPYFSAFSYKLYDFQKKKILIIKRVF